jgi:hypothetical protein
MTRANPATRANTSGQRRREKQESHKESRSSVVQRAHQPLTIHRSSSRIGHGGTDQFGRKYEPVRYTELMLWISLARSEWRRAILRTKGAQATGSASKLGGSAITKGQSICKPNWRRVEGFRTQDKHISWANVAARRSN